MNYPMLVFGLLRSLALIALFVPCGGALAQESATLPAKKQFHLFLLVGQSNMAGRGKITDQDKKPHRRVLMLTKDKRWVPAVAPVHFDKSAAGVGLARTFAIELANANSKITIGLIPCAAGGSPISSWAPGGYHGQTKSHPYDDSIKRAKAALKVGMLKGILWHQGESDSNTTKAKVYEQKLHEMIARFRKELDAADVPFLVGQMGQFPERPWSDAKKQVDKAHRDLPKKIEKTAFINSDDLTHKGDKVHFSAKAYRELGKRFAKAYQKMTTRKDDK